jgi:YD repeat-containing protein
MRKRGRASDAKATFNHAWPARATNLMMVATLTLGTSLAYAQEDPDPYDYTILGEKAVYPHADDACHAAHEADVLRIQNSSDSSTSKTKFLPYEPPVVDPEGSFPPTEIAYNCDTKYQLIKIVDGSESEVMMSTRLIFGTRNAKGFSCTNGKVENDLTGKCEDPDEDQARKESGNPMDMPLGGVATCAGNPISIASGNKYQEEEDYRDGNGELDFKRYYNGLGGTWTHSYGMTLKTSGNTLLLTFDDGRSSIFTLVNGAVVGEPTEQGQLQKVSGQWVYTAPDNTKYTFDTQGSLTRRQLADGRTQRIAYSFQTTGKVKFTVTDSNGHKLQYVTSTNPGPLESLTVDGMTITYTLGKKQIITRAVKTWGNHSTTRSYLYEDTQHPTSLTGIVDERGVRFATWHYDSQGRAISSEHANGAEKVSLDYQADGSVVVTNALGHHVTYRYQVIQGIKRVTAIEGEPAAGCPASNSTYTYTARGQIETKTDAVGTVTAYEYDTQGRETKRVEAKGTPQERAIATTWDPTRFLPLTITTPDRVTTYTYDAQGRLLSTSARAIKE